MLHTVAVLSDHVSHLVERQNCKSSAQVTHEEIVFYGRGNNCDGQIRVISRPK